MTLDHPSGATASTHDHAASFGAFNRRAGIAGAVTGKLVSIVSCVLAKAGLSERRKDGRVPPRGLDAFYWMGSGERHVTVKDISATGIYLHTVDRWLPGTTVLLCLRRRGLLERETQLEVRLRARCVRAGDDGVGFTFVEEPALAEVWSRSMTVAANLFAGSHAVRLLRGTRAIAFLLRTSPLLEGALAALLTSLCRDRAEHVIDIALQAEELLASSEHNLQSPVSPNLVLRILEDGSKATAVEVQQGWAGLLASCCQLEAEDAPLPFVDLMSKLDRDHVAVLTAACTRAIDAGWEPGFIFPAPLHCSSDEIRKITGIRNLVAIEGNLNHLFHLGLLEKTIKPLGCEQLEQVNITPTGLGLKLFVRWSGQNELPQVVDCPPLEMAS